MEIIKVQNLTYEYYMDEETPPKVALKDVSFSVREGEFISIIGRNGSGKSTLSKCLNGLLLPTSGDIIVDGYNTKDDDNILKVRQTCGMVFQNPDNQLVSSIVEDDVAFGPENLGVDPIEIRHRVDKALSDVGMSEFKLRPPHLLSGGQKQRIAIAGVLAMKPKCIVFDEPTAMLDPRGRREIMRIISELHSEGITVILITHFMEEAIKADRIIILDQGEILLSGSPREVFKDTKRIEEAYLELPFSVNLREKLKEKGIDIPDDIFTKEELQSFLCRL